MKCSPALRARPSSLVPWCLVAIVCMRKCCEGVVEVPPPKISKCGRKFAKMARASRSVLLRAFLASCFTSINCSRDCRSFILTSAGAALTADVISHCNHEGCGGGHHRYGRHGEDVCQTHKRCWLEVGFASMQPMLALHGTSASPLIIFPSAMMT